MHLPSQVCGVLVLAGLWCRPSAPSQGPQPHFCADVHVPHLKEHALLPELKSSLRGVRVLT
jgi:hypothetical protein